VGEGGAIVTTEQNKIIVEGIAVVSPIDTLVVPYAVKRALFEYWKNARQGTGLDAALAKVRVRVVIYEIDESTNQEAE
jgi:hypothetical protein